MALLNLCRNQLLLRYKDAWKNIFVLSQERIGLDSNHSRQLVISGKVTGYVQKSTFSTGSSRDTSNRPNFAKKKGLTTIEKAKLSELSGWKRRLEEDKMTKFGPWRPEKRVARSTMDQMRMLNQQFPDKYDIKALSAQFNISFEAVRRILHSKFVPTPEIAERQERKRAEQRKQYVDELMEKRRQEAREAKAKQASNETAGSETKSNKNDKSSSKLSEFDMKLQEGAIKINPMFNNDIMGVPIYKAVQRDLLPGEEKWKQKVRTSRAKRHAAMLGITEDQISKVRMLYNTIQAKESKKKETEWRKILAQRTNDESSIDKS